MEPVLRCGDTPCGYLCGVGYALLVVLCVLICYAATL